MEPLPLAPGVFLSTQDGYDQWATLYDTEDNPLIALEERELGAQLGDLQRFRGRAVVDVGCGTGRRSLPLSQVGAQVTALDFSSGMLAHAQRKAGALSLRFIFHDLNQPLPLPDAAFELVLNCLVLEHIADVGRLFAELARVCHRDGEIWISVMHPAMLLRGVSARFTHPETGERTYPQSHRQQIADYVMAATRAGLRFTHMSEHAVDALLMEHSVSAQRYAGWPMLLIMGLRRS